MEAVYREAKSNRTTLWLVTASVLVCAWAFSLDSSTTSYYSVDASSHFKQHSVVLSTLAIVTSIIDAVSKPFIAKISDITSRPYTYLLTLFFYVIGYIVAATCKTISAYVIGEVFVAIGSSGLDLTNDIIVKDLTPLEWRGFASSLLSTPFITNTWFAGKIVGGLLLIAYVIYEMKWARVPSAPRRLVFNKALIMSIIIDSIYLRKILEMHGNHLMI
ncbi:MFS general substrate transporter [Penicillium alfredii]|uniref:MFS general substrate transporter n=1 Tax=Penicillium alfredii TaxID=1506179 RepID=A0A9W9FL27_9EURO|nr:MFS general substrate transporter [Penicillium alfredii]KAJ5102201.1 MFS general substrate transporter [Penicillium alfredii]